MRVYPYEILVAANEEVNERLVKIIEEEDSRCGVESYKEYMTKTHRHLRSILHLPNRVFAFAIEKGTKKAKVLLFNVKPDEQVYEINVDEKGHPYIDVDC